MDILLQKIVYGKYFFNMTCFFIQFFFYLFFFLENPTYYGVEDISPEGINMYLSELIENTIRDLVDASCVEMSQNFLVRPSAFGRIASYYYISYKTICTIMNRISKDYKFVGDESRGERSDGDFAHLLRILADVPEYNELPVRHNEDKMNRDFEAQVPVPIMILSKKDVKVFGGIPDHVSYEDPHVKAFLLLQGHLTRAKSLPCSDYGTDTVSVLDQSIRIMQAMIDIAADQGFLATCSAIILMMVYTILILKSFFFF